MVQKVIKIGDSLGVTIPKKEALQQNIMPGDEVEISIQKKSSQFAKHEQLLKDLEDFMNAYDQDLKNLANR